MRFAIIGPLKCPPKGFEDVTKKHFTMCRKVVLVQARRWTMAAKGTELFPRFQKAYCELVTLLSELPSSPLTDEAQPLLALPPNVNDYRALISSDPGFVQQHKNVWKVM